MTLTSSDHELKYIKELEELLAQLFPVDNLPLRQIVRSIDASLLSQILWNTHALGVAEQISGALSARFGAWGAIHRLLEALHREYATNPAVTDLYRRVCASAYAGPLAASIAVREHAVRNFVTRHFPDYLALRAFDGRGVLDPASKPRFDSGRIDDAARYFRSLAQGLQQAREHVLLSARLDAYGYLLEGAIGYRSCVGLAQQIRRALATPEFLRPHGHVFALALEQIRRAFVEHLDAGLWPPMSHSVCHELSQVLVPVDSLPVGEVERRTLDAFAATVSALVLLEGHGIFEHDLIGRIEQGLPRLGPLLEPRLCALLYFRRCLAWVYCGQWESLRRQLETPPDAWDPNWSGFLWYELGEFRRSADSYARARHELRHHIGKAIGARSLLALVPVTHPRFILTAPITELSAVLVRQTHDADETERTRVRAELESALDDTRRHIPAAQTLFDRVTMLGLAAEFSDVARRRQRTADTVEGGRGIVFGGDATAPITRAYHSLWLCGIPAVGLRDESAQELVRTAMRIDFLPHVVEVAYATCSNIEWPRDRLQRAAARLASEHKMVTWRNFIADQADLLRRCAEECQRQEILAEDGRSLEEIQLHPIITRLIGTANLLSGLIDLLSDDVLEELAGTCARILSALDVRRNRFEPLTAACLELALGACTRLSRVPDDLGLEGRALGRLMITRRLFDLDRCQALSPLWPRLTDDAWQAIVAGACEALASWPEPVLESILGADDVPNPAKIERLFAASEAPEVSRDTLARDTAGHWSTWQNHACAGPILRLEFPPEPVQADTEELWRTWRAEVLSALADDRLARVPTIARSWANHGIYALSMLALQFADPLLWIEIFEHTRPWPLASSGCGFDLTALRRAIEPEHARDGLRRRFFQRLLSADRDNEWLAVVQVFSLVFRVGRTVLQEDVEVLRSFWERTRAHDLAAMQVFACIRLLLERLRISSPDPSTPSWEGLESVLRLAPHRLVQSGLLPRQFVAVLLDLCRSVDDLPIEPAYRDEWARLRLWLDEHGYNHRSVRFIA